MRQSAAPKNLLQSVWKHHLRSQGPIVPDSNRGNLWQLQDLAHAAELLEQSGPQMEINFYHKASVWKLRLYYVDIFSYGW